MSLQTINKIAAMAIAASLVATPAQAQPTQAEPAGRWALDYGDMSCNLQRTFKANDVVHLLRFERRPASDRLVLSVLSDMRGPSGDHESEGQLTTDSGAVVPIKIKRVPLAERRPRYSFTVNSKQAELGKVQNVLTINAGSMMEMHFQTGSLETPVAALDQCITDLYTELGVDGASLENVGSYPRLDQRHLLRYLPEDSYDADKGGGLEGMLQVDADGKVTSCTLSKPEDAATKNALCAIIANKARIEPAKGKDGQVMAAPLFFEISAVRRGSLIRN